VYDYVKLKEFKLGNFLFCMISVLPSVGKDNCPPLIFRL